MSQVTQRKTANKQAAMAVADKIVGPEKFIVPELTVKDVLSVIPYVSDVSMEYVIV
jgi:hypothetical protein